MDHVGIWLCLLQLNTDQRGKIKLRKAKNDTLDPMNIRQFSPADSSDVIALWTRCELVVPWNDPLKDIQRKLKVQPELFLVGEVDQEIVGSVMAGYEGHRGWINYLSVSPDHQGKQYARQLIEKVESLLLSQDCPKINLQIRSTNKRVIEFYEHLGYKEDHAVSMGKRLIPDL